MKVSTSLPLLTGIALMTGAGTRLSMQMGLFGWGGALVMAFAMGIVLVSREPARQLAQRVRLLELQLQEHAQVPRESRPPSAT